MGVLSKPETRSKLPGAMRNITILGIVALLMVNIAFAADSEDRTEYYKDPTTGYYIAEMIESEGTNEVGIDGNEISIGDSEEGDDHGWTPDVTPCTYTTAQASKGNVSKVCTGAEEADSLNTFDNTSFTGQCGVDIYIQTGGSVENIMAFGLSSAEKNIGFPQGGGTNFECNNGACDNTIGFSTGKWYSVLWNWTGSDVTVFIDNATLHTYATETAIKSIIFKTVGGAFYIDDFYCSSNLRPQTEAAPPAPTDPDIVAYTITGVDRYDSLALSNLTVTIHNATWNFTAKTSNGTIIILNNSVGNDSTALAFNNTYTLIYTSNQSGGYFTQKVIANITDGTSAQLNFTQSFLSLTINDLISEQGLSSFTVQTNLTSYEGSDGYILLPSKVGYHVFNITSSQYPLAQLEYTISALENLSFVANISPQFNFYLKREADNLDFDIASTNSTKLTIYCPSKNIEIYFRNETYNSTQENVTMDCPFTLMKMDISYTDSSYFRTLIPPTTQQNVTWWLLDLEKDTGVQTIIELVDLTGEWSNGLLRIIKAIGQNNEDMIEQNFDVSTAVTLYLLKDALYTVIIENNDGTKQRQLGSLIADTAETITITYPNLPFYPEESILEDNISWTYTYDADSLLRLQYADGTKNTTSIVWRIYNGTNATENRLLQTFTSALSEVTFTYSPVSPNQTYYTVLNVTHNLLDYNIIQFRSFGFISPGVDLGFQGFSDEQETNLKFFGSAVFLVVWGMLFSAKHAGVGLASTFIWTILFRGFGWLPIPYLWMSVLGFLAIGGFIYEGWRKN